MSSTRNAADPAAMAAAYRSGSVFLGELSMPVIDFRHYLEPQLDMHHSLQSFATRLRMQRQQGHADNQLIWFADLPYEPLGDALNLLERWLANDARPEDATDRCYSETGELIASGKGVWDGAWNGKNDGACMQRFPPYANPRLVAGDDFAGDILKCHLRSVDKAIADGVYAPIDVSARRDELKRTFPTGVCDYSLGDAGRPDAIL